VTTVKSAIADKPRDEHGTMPCYRHGLTIVLCRRYSVRKTHLLQFSMSGEMKTLDYMLISEWFSHSLPYTVKS